MRLKVDIKDINKDGDYTVTLKKNISLFLLMACIFACGEAEETTEPESEKPAMLEYGTVSGTVVDAGTGNRIPGSTVTLLGQSYETGVDGNYTFQGVLYGDVHTLTVTDPDYKPYSQPVVLNQERLVVDIAMTPLRDPVVELQEFFDNFAALLESVDMENTLVRSRLASAKVLETAFEELSIAPERRPETLDITEFAALANYLFFNQ